MTDETPRGPAGLDTGRPNLARMTDYLLGGKDNFAVDREAAEQILSVAPEVRTMTRETQAFHVRALRYLVEHGVTQFVNIGMGLPSQFNTHQIAEALTREPRTVYVSRDPVVLSHSRALLATDDSRTGVVEGDLLHPAELVADPVLRRVIDVERPVAIVTLGMLQFTPDSDDPFKRVAELRDWMPVGSHLVVAHAVLDSRPKEARPVVDVYQRVLNRTEDASRTREQVLGFFEGLTMVEPGLVYLRQWRPDNPLAVHRPEAIWMVGGIGRKDEA
ncbi:SAM-dependent methyltransferase [Sphaerisporangium album]|uniref:SAM-dependent methyltransferase n=1 Tax=Sphaerisporangium album TaxID=509200 RepID=A0A367ESC4_9ACTN|nr:SAM-dependent methyltransferase [Sphaerisporangium album]RCG20984.1 SAM-dependent methyltransferase [Sphaerisporangium album]